ncbi:chemotaxis protein R [Fulvitalea axinellae]|uniref:Chemotaxis protein R n=1 Tax=Fulvitalea axinellae TaxID=1182444 RepID=A0AAU9CQD4_9BACT|nr:chemotaxis protein R [Fulvitalea axinellae]
MREMREIEIAELRKLTEFIAGRYGYDFRNYAMSSFRRRVQRILELYKFPSVAWLIQRMEGDADFFETFLSELTVNVTEMFRDPSFWRELRDHTLPNILLNHERINIWHAGCSSGEEVYSMAIMLHEAGLLDRVRIYATDIDKGILEQARGGSYSLRNMELNEKNYIRFQGKKELKEYYTVRNDRAWMDKSLLRSVTFREHDLVKSEIFNKFDLVLCRNVMIYFNQTLQNEVLKKLHSSLFKYGYLVVGSKESLIWSEIANKFIVVNNEEKIYKKIRE